MSSSAAGASVLLVFAVRLNERSFSLVTLMVLIMSTAVGMQRGWALQPALVRLRTTAGAVVGVRTFSTIASIVAVAAFAAGLSVSRDLGIAVYVLAATIFALAQDWLRFVAISVGMASRAAWSDSFRLVLVVVLLVIPLGSTGQAVIAFGATYLIASVPLWSVARYARHGMQYSEYRRDATAQGLDFTLSQMTSTLPLLVLGTISNTPLIGGIRLAQTLLGPLNLVFASATANFMARGALDQKLRKDDGLIRAGKRDSTRLLILSAVAVAIAICVSPLLSELLRGVSAHDLTVGVVLAGALALTSGWSGYQNVVIRMLGHSRRVAVARAVVTAVSVLAFVAGFLVGGGTASLVGGLLVSAVAYPLVFGFNARRVYQDFSLSGDNSADVKGL